MLAKICDYWTLITRERVLVFNENGSCIYGGGCVFNFEFSVSTSV